MRAALAWAAGIFATIVLSAQTATTLVIRGHRQYTYVYGPSIGSTVVVSIGDGGWTSPRTSLQWWRREATARSGSMSAAIWKTATDQTTRPLASVRRWGARPRASYACCLLVCRCSPGSACSLALYQLVGVRVRRLAAIGVEPRDPVTLLGAPVTSFGYRSVGRLAAPSWRHRFCAAASRGSRRSTFKWRASVYSSIAAAPGLTHTILMSVVL